MKFHLIKKPQGPILEAYTKCRERVSFIRGPLGSGKTFESCAKVLSLMCEQKPNRQGLRKTRFFAIRNTYPDLLGMTMKDWMELFGELGQYKGGGMEPPCHKLRFKLKDRSIVQSELIFLALDRPQSIKKLRGSQATGFWLNETKELDKAIVDMADLRHGRYPSKMDGGPTWHGMLGDTNAPDEDHWYYELEREVKPEGWSFFVQPGGLMREMQIDEQNRRRWTGRWVPNAGAENLHNLPEDYYTRGQQGKSTDWISVNLGNEFGSVHTGKAIYEHQWVEDIHVSDAVKFIPDHPLEIGLDFGLTPSAIIGQQTARGGINVIDELVAQGMGINQFVKTVLKPHLHIYYRKASEVTYIGDPAGDKRAETDEQTVFKELADLGIEAFAANSNDPEIRWEAVRWYLEQLRDGKPAVQVHPRCKYLISGYNGGYQLRRLQIAGAEAKYHEKADKNKYSHPHDANQYLFMYYRGDYEVPTSLFERDEEVAEDMWGM